MQKINDRGTQAARARRSRILQKSAASPQETRSRVIEMLESRMMLAVAPVGPEFLVNTTTADVQREPSTAMDAAGDFVVSWQNEQYPDWGVYVQRYNAAGVAQGNELRVSTPRESNFSGLTFAGSNPSVAMNAAGDFVVSWQSYDPSSPFLGEYGIYARRYNAAGVPQGSEIHVNSYTANDQLYPSVAMDAAGDFVVSWQTLYSLHGPNYGDYFDIRAQRYNAAGVPQGSELHVGTTVNDDERPSVAMDQAGEFVGTWQGSDGGYDAGGYFTNDVYARRYNAAGVAQGTEFHVSTFTTGNQSIPAMAMDPAGDFVTSWQSGDGSDFGIYAQAYNVAGVAQGSEFRVNTTTAGRQNHPSIAMDASGDFVVSWQSNLQDGSGYGIYAQRYESATGQFHGTVGDDTYIVRLAAAGSTIQVFDSTAPGAKPIYSVGKNSSPPLTFITDAGNDTLILDFTNGNPIPAGGLTLDGGAGNDLLNLIGSAGSDTISITGTQVSFGNTAITYNAIEQIAINTAGGDDTLTLDFGHGNPIPNGGLNFDAAGGNDTIGFIDNVPGRPAAASVTGNLTLTGGNITLATDANGLAITASGTANATFAGSQHLASLTLADSAKVALALGGGFFIRVGLFSLAGAAGLDLNDNDLILQSNAGSLAADLTALTGLIHSGRNGGDWGGKGIISSTAAAEPNKLTGLAIALNDKGNGLLLYSTFDGEPVDANSILVKYTYNGDADLSGKIDADDYFQIDNGFASKLAGYRNGDFDFNGVVDADDYFLIDRAFVGQAGVLAAKALTPAVSQLRGNKVADRNVRTTARSGRHHHYRR